MAHILPPIINFGVVVFILVFFGRKPFIAALASRHESIAKHVKEAEEQARQAQGFLSEWETSWANAEAHVATLQREIQEGLRRLKEKTLAAAQTESSRIQQEAKLVAKGEAQKTKQEIQREVAGKSITLAKEFLDRQLSEKDQKKLVLDYVEGLR